MDKFLKLPNFQKSHAAFQKWMQTKYNVDVSSIKDTDCKILLFNTMKETKENINNGTIECNSETIHVDELNNMVLNKLQKYYVDKYSLISMTEKLHVESLNRDSDLYGNRPVQPNEILPRKANDTEGNDDINAHFSRLVSERDNRSVDTISPNNTLPSINQKENPIPIHEFDQLLKKAQSNTLLEENIELKMPKVPENPKEIFQKPLEILTRTQIHPADNQSYSQHASVEPEHESDNINNESADNINTTESADFVATQPLIVRNDKKYIVINGFDRDITNYSYRYNWRVNLNNPIKNIKNIKFNRLILPIENNDRKNKSIIYHNRDYKLGIQYVSLQVAELTDTYQGTTQEIGSTTVCFIFDTSYTCSNGRGYIIMKPSQDEVKEYHQQLTSLSSLSISLTKPSGMLISQTRDMYKVRKIEFEYYNQLYLKVVLDKYFDKGEFNVGDNIKISGYEVFKTSVSADTTQSDIIELMSFANNKHGHEIVEMGDSNEQGFYNTFYIPAPTKFNEEQGRLIIKENIIAALREFNSNSSINADSTSIINMSLQPSIHFEVDVEEGGIFQSHFIK